VIPNSGYLCASASRSRYVCSSATVSTGQHRYVYRRSAIQSAQCADVHRPRLRSTDHGYLVVPGANSDRFGRLGFSVSGPNQWNKLPPVTRKVSDKPEQFARTLRKLFYFQTAPTGTSEDNIKRRDIAKTSSTSTSTHSYISVPLAHFGEGWLRLNPMT